MNGQSLTPAELIALLQRTDLPPGTQIITAVVPPPEGAEIVGVKSTPEPPSLDPDYRRFVPTKDAVRLMKNRTTVKRLQTLARRSYNREIVALKQGYHYTDHASHGSSRARWRFHPERCDEFFARCPDARVKPARRRVS